MLTRMGKLISRCTILTYVFCLVAFDFSSLPLRGSAEVQGNCKEEISTQNDGNGGETTFVWSTASRTDNHYYSLPLCLNEKKEIVYRTCEGPQWDQWKPKDPPFCNGHAQAEEPPICPSDLQEYVKNEEVYCYKYTESQTFPPKCPYPGQLNIPQPQYGQPNPNGYTIWMPQVQRTVPFGFGSYVYNMPMLLHGTEAFTYSGSNYAKGHLEKCVKLPYHDGNEEMENLYESADCNSTNVALCIYEDNFRHPLCPSWCLYNVYSQRCYCKANFETPINSTDTIMQAYLSMAVNMAEKPYLNHLIKKIDFLPNERCRIGLEKSEYGTYVWTKIQKEIDYSNWQNNVNFSKSKGVINSAGKWSLVDEDDDTIFCVIWETALGTVVEPKMTLYQPRNTYKLYLEVENIFSIMPLEDSETVRIICFSNAYPQHGFQFRYQDSDFPPPQSITNRHKIFEIPMSYNLGYWWCEGFALPNITLFRSNLLLASNFRIFRNYVVVANLMCHDWNNVQECINFITAKLINEFAIFEVTQINEFNANINGETLDAIYHVTMPDNSILSIVDEYKLLNDRLYNLQINKNILSSAKLLSSDFCLPEQNITCFPGVQLNWPLTPLGATAIPNPMCLQPDGKPVIRKCSGIYETGATWGPIEGSCRSCIKLSNITKELQEIRDSLDDLSTEDLVESLSRILADDSNSEKHLEPIDVYLISEILKYFVNRECIDAETVLQLVNHLMDVSRDVLVDSQDLLNATDSLLNSMDVALLKQNFSEETLLEILTPNMYTIQAYPEFSNISGLALYQNSSAENFYDFEMQILYANTSLEEVLEDSERLGLVAATLLPDKILNQIHSHKDVRLIILVFLKDTLFNQNPREQNGTIDNGIFSITLANLNEDLRVPIPLVLKKPSISHNHQSSHCVFWHYGTEKFAEAIKGRWETDYGTQIVENVSESHAVCQYEHLTHFGLLVTGNPRDEELSDADKTALQILTAIGCGLSILGIFGIFLTAVLFRTWRTSKGNVFLLNISFAILMQTVFMYLATLPDSEKASSNKWVCVGVSVVLHYVLLVEFCWMLVIALLQYRRFVQVLTAEPQNIVIKACLLTWGTPLIPVIVLLTISPDNYINDGLNCYPTGLELYIGVLAPISAIIIINVFIFYLIIKNLCCNRQKVYGSDYNLILAVVKLSVLLFFMLGCTWLFGILVALGAGVVFSYLFCLTAPLQGLVLFVFFILSNTETRRMWQNRFYICCHNGDENKSPTTTTSRRMSSDKYY